MIQEWYDGADEREVLASMIADAETLARIVPQWGEGLFASRQANRIGGWAVDYYRKHGKAPGRQIESYFVAFAQDSRDRGLVEAIESLLSQLSAWWEQRDDAPAAHRIEVAERCFNRSLIREMSEHAQAHLNSGDLGDVIERFERYKPITLKTEPILRPGSEVVCKKTVWLWEPWVPLNEVVLIDGQMGQGKSLLVVDLVARASRGWKMPHSPREEEADRAPVNCVIASGEASWERMVAPRLRAAGADMDRCFEPVKPLTLPDGLRDFERECAERKVRLIVFDPVKSYIGEAKFDDNNAIAVRALLKPLSETVERLRAAAIIIRHYRKAGGGTADRGAGSGAWAQVPQICHHLGKVEEDGPVVLACGKSNLGPTPKSLGFTIEAAEAEKCPTEDKDRYRIIPSVVVNWTGEVDYSANDVARRRPRRARAGRTRARKRRCL
jgi:hypothetical protein